jgi:hypothetical protein
MLLAGPPLEKWFVNFAAGRSALPTGKNLQRRGCEKIA